MSVAVCRIQPTDALALREIRLAALADAPFAFARTHQEERALPFSFWAERAASNSTGRMKATFVAVVDQEWVGLVGAIRDDEASPEMELVSMWVAPNRRGLGTGRALVASVVGFAEDAGCREVQLWVTRGNEPALALYASCGFVQYDELRPSPADPCRDEIRMRLELGSA